jgi:hypothetical protein
MTGAFERGGAESQRFAGKSTCLFDLHQNGEPSAMSSRVMAISITGVGYQLQFIRRAARRRKLHTRYSAFLRARYTI